MPKHRGYVLIAIAQNLPEQLLGEMLRAIHDLDDWNGADILAAIAPRLPDTLLDEALLITRAIRSPEKRAEFWYLCQTDCKRTKK